MSAPWVIAGASGVVGRHLVAALRARGLPVRILTRRPEAEHPEGVEPWGWDPPAAAAGAGEAREQVRRALDGAAVVVNLAGATLAEGRLTARLKQRILQSRVDATNALTAAHEAASAAPPVWLQASAVGYYGDTGEAKVTETAPAAEDFYLSDVCQAWEAAAAPVAARARLVVGRIGLVLAADAPAWQIMVAPIRWGLGGPLGSGRQWYPWIDADDLAAAWIWLAAHDDAVGAYNLCAPEPVRQIDMVRAVAHQLRRPVWLPAPAWALKLAVGAGAEQLILPSCRALPVQLQAGGFAFRYARLDDALPHLLRRP